MTSLNVNPKVKFLCFTTSFRMLSTGVLARSSQAHVDLVDTPTGRDQRRMLAESPREFTLTLSGHDDRGTMNMMNSIKKVKRSAHVRRERGLVGSIRELRLAEESGVSLDKLVVVVSFVMLVYTVTLIGLTRRGGVA